MKREIIVVIGFFFAFFASLGAFKIPEEIGAGEDMHSEVYRLRQDVRGIRNVLIVANGLLAAILAALLF